MVGYVFRRAYETCRKPEYLLPALGVSAALGVILRAVSQPFEIPAGGQLDSRLVLNLFARPLIVLGISILGIWPSASVLSLALALLRGEHATFGSQWVSFGVAIRLVLVEGVAGLVMLIGCVLLILPGVFVAVVWSQIRASIVDGRTTFFNALEDSQDLTRGCRGDVFAVLLAIFVLSGAVFGLTLALSHLIGTSSTSWTFTLVSVALSALLYAFSTAAGAALYLELVGSAAPLTRSSYFLAPVDSPS